MKAPSPKVCENAGVTEICSRCRCRRPACDCRFRPRTRGLSERHPDIHEAPRRRHRAAQRHVARQRGQEEAARSDRRLSEVPVVDVHPQRDRRLHGKKQGLVRHSGSAGRRRQGTAGPVRKDGGAGLQHSGEDQAGAKAGGRGRRRRQRPASAEIAHRAAVTPTPGPARGLPDSISHPVLARAPEWATPFIQLARIDRPIGWQLILLPCWESSALASAVEGKGLHITHMLLFLIGAIAMRGAGSTYNDLVDRDIDAQVERTRGRPLPSGRATPKQAAVFIALQCLVGLAVLLCFNAFAIATGFASIAIVLAYPFMKRITSWPQAVLGLAFAWGALMGWAAVFGSLAPPAFLLYGSAILWTIGYDTIYALQDIRDDAIAGVRSTARLFGDNVRVGVGAMYAGAAALAEAAVLAAHVHWSAQVGVIAFAAHLAWQVSAIRQDDKACALKLFRANRDAGFLLFAGLAAAALA
ncbi:MAG: 4-hydroxybenzoate octaprenyltransferase [Hyphomicrobiales bacterium]|nr:4-hydroxybenzoate octaprenyltransferase [Hyphomicrobiales bacterium]